MEIKKKVIKEENVVDHIVCDKCHQKCDEYCSARLIYGPGYGSNFDGEWWQVDLCEECWKQIMFLVTGEIPEAYSGSKYRLHGALD